MNIKFIPTLFVTLIGGTALSTPAFAQTSEGLIAEGQNCEALSALATEEEDRLNPEWVTQSGTVAGAGDEQQCLTYYEDASTALADLDSGAEMDAESGRIVVTQPDPSVTVQQDAPEVAVMQPQPQVSVRQGQPEVIVRQVQPTIRVQIPQPVITIDQPQPEIIVRMPEPEVGVTTPEPQVQVSQNEPTVSVEQAEPQVQVQLPEPDVDVDDRGDADVTVAQDQALVRQVPSEGAAEVDIQQQEPAVSYESAEPNIVFEETPDPRVEYTESGEADIRVEQQQRAEGGQAGTQGLGMQDTGAQQAGAQQAHPVGDIIGMVVVDAGGAELGNVDRLVTDGERNYVILAGAGALGASGEGAALPVETVIVAEDRLMVDGMTQEDINAMPDFDTASAEDIGTEHEIRIRSQ